MLISSILNPLPKTNSTPAPQESDEATSETTSTPQSASPSETEKPAQSNENAAAQPARQPSDVTSQSVFEATTRSNSEAQSQDAPRVANTDILTSEEALARAAAEAYRVSAQQTAILERNALPAKSSTDDLLVSEAKPMASGLSHDNSSTRLPLDKTV